MSDIIPIRPGVGDLADIPFTLHDFGPRGSGGPNPVDQIEQMHPGRGLELYMTLQGVGGPTPMDLLTNTPQIQDPFVVLPGVGGTADIDCMRREQLEELSQGSGDVIPIPDNSGSMSDLYPTLWSGGTDYVAVWGRAEDMQKQLAAIRDMDGYKYDHPTAQILQFPKKQPPTD